MSYQIQEMISEKDLAKRIRELGEEISRDYTANAMEKLARYDGAELVRIRSLVTSWPQGPVNTLEVVLRV